MRYDKETMTLYIDAKEVGGSGAGLRCKRVVINETISLDQDEMCDFIRKLERWVLPRYIPEVEE